MEQWIKCYHCGEIMIEKIDGHHIVPHLNTMVDCGAIKYWQCLYCNHIVYDGHAVNQIQSIVFMN